MSVIPEFQTKTMRATQQHYDDYHFIEGGISRIRWWRDYLISFLPDQEIKDKLIVDVGSSVGEISRGLIDRDARLVCLDLSIESLHRCTVNNPEATVIHGNALALPFPDRSFDHAISIGVLHHTPDCRRGFKEVARVTAESGLVLIFLYNKWSFYNLAYNWFAPIRNRIPLGRVPKWIIAMMQPFVRWHLGQTLSDKELRNLVGDKLWTPQATFHSVREVRAWGEEEGLEFLNFKRFFLAYANVMLFRKRGSNDTKGHRLPLLKCSKCQNPAMERHEDRYVCRRCSHIYPIQEKIVRSLN